MISASWHQWPLIGNHYWLCWFCRSEEYISKGTMAVCRKLQNLFLMSELHSKNSTCKIINGKDYTILQCSNISIEKPWTYQGVWVIQSPWAWFVALSQHAPALRELGTGNGLKLLINTSMSQLVHCLPLLSSIKGRSWRNLSCKLCLIKWST